MFINEWEKVLPLTESKHSIHLYAEGAECKGPLQPISLILTPFTSEMIFEKEKVQIRVEFFTVQTSDIL